MELLSEREEIVHKFDLDLTPDEAISLRDIGYERIKTDDQALIEYAVIKLLEDKIRSVEIEEPKENE